MSLEEVKNEGLISRLGLYCFKSPNHIHEYSLKILASKNFPLLTELNQFIQMATEAGLIVKWLKGYRFASMYEKKPLFEYIEVKMEMFVCFVIIVGSLQVFTCFIGTLEKIAYEKIQLQKVSPFWRRVDIAINPYRYLVFGNYNAPKEDRPKKFGKSKKITRSRVK